MTKPPKLFIIFGPSGAGKTTAGAVMAEKIKVEIFSTDKIRRTKPFRAKTHDYQKTGKFFPKTLRRQFYLKLMADGKKELLKGHNVILDATFSSAWMWQMAEKLAAQTRAQMIPMEIILEKISDATLKRRLENRLKQDQQAAQPQIYWAYKNRFQPYAQKHFVINNDGSRAKLRKQILEILNEIL